MFLLKFSHRQSMVIAVNLANGIIYGFNNTESHLEVSLRRFRRKLRFNFAMGYFQPKAMITFTLDERNFDLIKDGSDGSALMRECSRDIQKYLARWKMCWRAEVGTKSTKRLHFHCLVEAPFVGNLTYRHEKVKRYSKEKGFYIKDVLVPKDDTKKYLQKLKDCLELIWGRGFVRISGIYDENGVLKYITKYMSKSVVAVENGEEIKEEDSCKYCKRRWGTSWSIVPPPKSLWKVLSVAGQKKRDGFEAESDYVYADYLNRRNKQKAENQIRESFRISAILKPKNGQLDFMDLHYWFQSAEAMKKWLLAANWAKDFVNLGNNTELAGIFMQKGQFKEKRVWVPFEKGNRSSSVLIRWRHDYFVYTQSNLNRWIAIST